MRYLTIFVAYYCLFSFKTDLLPFADSSVRIDDFLLLVFAGCYLATQKKTYFPKALRTLTVFFLISILSVSINIGATGINVFQGLLFSIRHLEYAVFFFVGVLLFTYGFNWRRYLTLYLIYSLGVGLLTMLEIIPNASRFHFDRISANTTGPFEYAVVMSFVFLFYFGQGQLTRTKNLIAVVVSLLGVGLTYSRVTLVALIFSTQTSLEAGLSKGYINKLPFRLVVFSTFCAIGFISYYQDWGIVSRFTSLLDGDTIASFSILFENYPTVETQQEYFSLVYNDNSNTDVGLLSGDTSALIRFNKWLVLVASTFKESLMLGLGPSFASVGVDGYFVRVFAETGLLGLIIYCKFIYDIYSFSSATKSLLLRRYILVLLLTGLFIDIFVSFKPMMLLWLYYGYSYASAIELYQKNKPNIGVAHLSSHVGGVAR